MGMPNITFRCQMFRGDWDQVWSQMRMLWLMEGLCRVNQTHLRQFDEFQRRGLVERGYPSVYRSGLHYETEKGTEIWPDIPSLLMGTMGKGNYPGHWGDCLPATTSVLRVNDHLVVPIGDLASGDQIVGDGKDTTVTAHAITGMKTILELELDNKKMFRGSPEHRVFSQDGAERRVEDVEVGDLLRTPTTGARVVAIREVEPELCCDITTDTGSFYLPESDLVVHNCEDLACYRVAELRELPEHYERPAPWDKSKTEQADPRYPQPAQTTMTPAGPVALSGAGDDPWAGWKKVRGGVRAKPFAKWRRGPGGNYHYHALVYLPDGRLEDPSLVLGMGREKAFDAAGMAKKLQQGGAPVVIQFAKAPEVMVVDPEKPSGYGGGIAPQLDADILKKAGSSEALQGDAAEVGAYMSNEIYLGETEFDVDAAIGWSRAERCFAPRSELGELRRLMGYSRH